MMDASNDTSDERTERERRLLKLDAEIENLRALTKKARWETRWQPFVALWGVGAAGYAFTEFVLMKL